MTDTAPKTGLVANEPVLVASFVAWLFTVLGTFILGHTDLITSDQWGSLSTILVPVVSGVVLAGLAWVTRRVVAPAWKLLTKQTEKIGIPDEIVEAMIANGVKKELSDLKVKYPNLAAALEAAEKGTTAT